MITRLSVWLVVFVCATAWGSDSEKPSTDKVDCASALSHGRSNFIVIPSNRVPSEAEKYKDYVQGLTKPGGTLDKLGIRMTGQIVEFLEGKDLNALTSGSGGGYPVSFYLDGANIIRSYRPSGGFALEVVYPGPQFQHGFYRDDNPMAEQISIIDHVVGHNNFAYISGFPHYRAAQGLLASRQMDEVLTSVYRTFDKDAVQRYYLWSLTAAGLLDYYTPYYEPIEKFEAKLQVSSWDPLGRTKPEIARHPKAPTENVLAAFAANISPHQPKWKQKILGLHYQSMAFRPALVHTQIMNEGWASIMQEILPNFTENHHLPYWLNAHRVMQNEAKPNLRDPYSLGVFSWRHLKKKFMNRPEVLLMPTLEDKYKAFIQWANDEIISRMDDSQFLRLAMDQEFVDRNNLAIVRRAVDHEIDPMAQPPKMPDGSPAAQWIVVARDAEKVARAVIDMVVKPKYMFHPRVRLEDFNRPESGEVDLIIDDSVGNSLAMEKTTLAPALYALTQVIDKPVSLECMVAGQAPPPPPQHDPGFNTGFNPFGPPPRRQQQKPEPPPLERVRVVVSPKGEVRAFRLRLGPQLDPRNDSLHKRVLGEDLDQQLTDELSHYFRGYIDDLYLEDEKEHESVIEGSQTLREIVGMTVARAVDDTPYDGLVAQAPNSAGAISEYKTMVERRMLKAMERAANTGRGLRVVGNAVRVKALPSEVRLEFDMQYAQMVKQATPVQSAKLNSQELNKSVRDSVSNAPVFAAMHGEDDLLARGYLANGAFGPYEGGSGQVGDVNGNPGDRFWGPGDGGGAGGKPVKPGEDANDPSWVEIPSDLYEKFLAEKVKFPNLNNKRGQSRVKRFKPGRRANRMFGQMLPMDIAENAYKRGYAKAEAEGRDPDADSDLMINEGLDELQPRDWVVKSKTVTRKPEVKAVVTFALDASGSTADYMDAFKRFVHDMETVVRANYKGFDFRYIVFDTKAHVMKNKREFFNTDLKGGTAYYIGLDGVIKLLEDEYPRASWDRFTFVLGDMEDFDENKSFAKLKDLLDISEYAGFVAGLNDSGGGMFGARMLQFLEMVKGEVQSNPSLGLTILNDDGTYRIDNIRELLKDKDE